MLLSSAVYAKETVFNDRILSGENIDIDDFTFIVTMNKYASAIFVDAGTMYKSIQLYQCKDMESFTICFKNTTYDEEENALYAEINITRSKPDVSVTRVANDTEVYVGQEIEVTLTIDNTGDTASNIIVTDDYPPSIEIYDMEGGCQMHENQVYWQGHLDKDEDKVCTFLIKPKKELHQSFVAHLKYWDGFKWINEYSTTMTLDAEPVIDIFSSIVREDYEVDGTTFDFDEDNPSINIGETLRLVLNITNNYEGDVDVSKLEIQLPPKIKYSSIGNLRFNYINASGNRSSIIWSSDRIRKISDTVLRWDGRISENRSKLFIIKLTAERTGDQNLIMNVGYNYDNLMFEASEQETLHVREPGLAIRMTVEDESKLFSAPVRLDEEDDNIDIEAMHPYRVRIYAQNTNKYAKLTDVDVRVYTELAGFKQVHYNNIDEEGQKIPYSIVLIPPYIDSSKVFETNVSISYKNEYGESHFNSTEFSINVQPSKDITVEWDSSEGIILEGGEETEIKVSVTNDRLVDLKNVEVTDKIPAELHVEGVHSKKVKLNKEDDTEVYTYRITPPIVKKKTDYNITTHVEYFDPDLRQTFNFTEISTLTVEPLKPDISIDILFDKPDTIYPGTIIPVEYTVRNDEEQELVRDITIYFPIQEEMDLIGPEKFLIDKLDPGEEMIIRNLIKMRPKLVRDSLKINMTTAEYYDNYGNIFYENSTEESFDVDDALINGPSIFLRTIVPDVINKSTDTNIKIQINNNGSAAADITVRQGEKIWNKTVAAYSAGYIDYSVRYDSEGNYTIPDPYVTFSFQGLQAHTKGTGAEAYVKLLLGPQEIVEEEVVEIVAEEIPEREKDELSFVDYEEKIAREQMRIIMRYGLLTLITIIVLVLIAAYIGYQRRKGPSQPFMET